MCRTQSPPSVKCSTVILLGYSVCFRKEIVTYESTLYWGEQFHLDILVICIEMQMRSWWQGRSSSLIRTQLFLYFLRETVRTEILKYREQHKTSASTRNSTGNNSFLPTYFAYRIQSCTHKDFSVTSFSFNVHYVLSLNLFVYFKIGSLFKT